MDATSTASAARREGWINDVVQRAREARATDDEYASRPGTKPFQECEGSHRALVVVTDQRAGRPTNGQGICVHVAPPASRTEVAERQSVDSAVCRALRVLVTFTNARRRRPLQGGSSLDCAHQDQVDVVNEACWSIRTVGIVEYRRETSEESAAMAGLRKHPRIPMINARVID